MKLWFELASQGQRLNFMVLALEAEHTPAFPLIENDFIDRGKVTDDGLLMEVLSYCRHRRQLAAPFLSKFKKGKSSNDILSICDALVAPGSFEQLVEQRNDQTTSKQFENVLSFSIAMPWRTHSMMIEPAGMHRATLEHQLQVLVEKASIENDLRERLSLLTIATQRADALREILQRSRKVYGKQLDLPDAVSMANMVKQLGQLLSDQRPILEPYNAVVTTPATKAANLIWSFWAPRPSEMDELFRHAQRDWRTHLLKETGHENDDLLCEMSRKIVQSKTILKPEVYPSTDARKLVTRLKSEQKGQVRRQIAALNWYQKLMVIQEVQRDKDFCKRLEPSILEWVEWNLLRGSRRPSAGFSTVWDTLAKQHHLTEEGLIAIRNWLLLESESDRCWSVAIVSRPAEPGLKILLSPSDLTEKSDIEKKEPADSMIEFSRRMRIKTYKSSFGTRTFAHGLISEGKLVLSETDEFATKEQANQLGQIAAVRNEDNSDDPIVGIEILFKTSRRPMVDSKIN